MYGGAGNDQFVLEYFDASVAAKNQDIVIDFQKGADKIDLRTLGISDFNTISLLTSEDTDTNAIISTRYDFYDGDYYYRLKINGIRKSQLQASDFIFNSAVVTNNQFVNASNAHIVFSQSSGSLFYNRDGNLLGTGIVFEFARLGNPNITLNSSNFSLIA